MEGITPSYAASLGHMSLGFSMADLAPVSYPDCAPEAQLAACLGSRNKAESPAAAQSSATLCPSQLLTDEAATPNAKPSALYTHSESTLPSLDIAHAHEPRRDISDSRTLGKRVRSRKKTSAKWGHSRTPSDETQSVCHLRALCQSGSAFSNSPELPTSRPTRPALKQRSTPNIALNSLLVENEQLMATNFGGHTGDTRRGVSSPRPKREAKNTFCRNVTIYGHCRYENTCPYVHDPSKLTARNENMKKQFNVDSPSFTPLQPNTNGSLTPSSRNAAISPKAANAAVFTPKSQRSTTSTPSMHNKEPALEWHHQDYQEFVPQTFDGQMVDPNASAAVLGYDPFNTTNSMSTIAGSAHQAASLNPYAQDPTGLTSASFYQNANAFQNQPSYHLYWPIGPQPTNLLAYQRTAHDFFIPEALREDLQKKAEVARQVLPNSNLPPIEQYHSLVCLDTAQHKNQSLFGFQSWVYKAVSSKDGNTYALRRLEGFRLTNENAIRSVQPWKRVLNGSVVTIHDAFTTRAFGDSSLIIVTDYHPCSKTLAEEHFKTQMSRFHGRQTTSTHIPEQVLWGYIVQIASALKAIHGSGLAARLIAPSKVLLTSKDRIRLNACAILDVVQYENSRSLSELQGDDLMQLGRLILCIANGSPTAFQHMAKSMDNLSRNYTQRLKECVQWLLNPQPAPGTPTSPTTVTPMQKDVDTFLGGIADQAVSVLDSNLHYQDTLVNTLGRELESSRIARLLMKMGFINERPELDASIPVPSGSTTNPSSSWAETGERYYLKLFRDYVFHQVDANGHPVINLAHVLDCLNKLDAGSEEKISLVSRDEQNVLVVSYRELKRGLESAFQDLIKAGRGPR